MKITKELNLTNFDFWSGAKDHNFTYNELKELEAQIEELFFEEAPTETDINDLSWFETDQLCEWIGLDIEEYNDRD